MYWSILAFVSAVALANQTPFLPAINWQLGALILLCIMAYYFRRLRILCSFVLGLSYVIFIGAQRLEHWLPLALQGQEMLVQGWVSSLPKVNERGLSFEFTLIETDGAYKADKISLSWYHAQAEVYPKAGEHWRLVVKLHRPHGAINPGLFDYEAWLLTKGISAVGYVRANKQNERLAEGGIRYQHQQWREKLRAALFLSLPDDDSRALIIALLIGESNQMSRAVWQTLSNTGTNHLLIISGLHVGLVAGLMFTFWQRLLRFFTVSAKAPAGIIALIFAINYGLIAGMGLPVQRALVMVTVGLVALLLKRHIALHLILLYALLIVMLANPFAPLGAGFWLSFGAVASIVFVFSGRIEARSSLRHKLVALLETQWVVFLATAPLLIYWVSQLSLVGFIINLFAIPFIGLIIVPLLLLATPLLLIGVNLGFGIVELVHTLLTGFLAVLGYFADREWVFQQSGTPISALIFACLGSLLLLMPKGLVPRYLGIILFLPMLLRQEINLDKGDLYVQVLDVGQGLSIVMRTQHHAVVYDTGPAFGPRFDTGEQILAPTLKALGINLLHTLVVSHGDMDHAGGVKGLENKIPILQKFTSDAERSPPNIQKHNLRCAYGQQWQLDDVSFYFLTADVSPKQALRDTKSSNNSSCVLLVVAGDFSLLLPGDIEAPAEAQLLLERLPKVNLLIAPHHGSLSSSTPAFLNRISPETVVISAGFMNQFGHPHRRVLNRYKARKYRILSTAESGAILIWYKQGRLSIETAREKYPRFWYR